ncbi:DUF4328 domain-containing protein [Nakamurella sp. GG22]
MTAGQPLTAGQRPPRYIRCAYCQMPQPVGSAGPSRCVACGAPLQRWIAHPPPGGPPSQMSKSQTPATRRRRPYLGPPSYRGDHPRWSFPAVVWTEAPEPAPPPVKDPVPALRGASWLALLTGLAALTAAGAETWRYVLMVQGRTLVLSGTAVRTSDILVASAGLTVIAAALVTVVLAVPALVRSHVAAARRLGREPSRKAAGIIPRLLVPVWNIYGAGQIITEIDRMLVQGSPNDERVRRSRLPALWWAAWICSAVLLVITLARGAGGSLQAIADTVELHIAVDLLAAVVAFLSAVLFRRFAGIFRPRRAPLDGWVVKPPDPTRQVPPPLAADPTPDIE